MDLKNERQKNQYERVNKLYITGSYTIDEACKKVGICRKTYYNIKKKIGKNDNKNIQKGGDNNKNIQKEVDDKKIVIENKSNIINNVHKNTNDILRGTFEEKLKKIQNIW